MGWAGGSHAPRLPTVELKIEVVLPEKDRGKEELSTGSRGSPRAYQGNGAARHFHADERLPTAHPYPRTAWRPLSATSRTWRMASGCWAWEGVGGGGGALPRRLLLVWGWGLLPSL